MTASPVDMARISQSLSRARLSQAKDRVAEARTPARPDQTSREQAELKQACAGFEAIFMQTVLKNMRASLPGNALFPDSNAVKIYRSMQDQHLADHLASGSRTSMGIKEFLYEELKDSVK